MKKRWFRLCSLVLTIALLANMLPLSVFAQQNQDSTTLQTITEPTELIDATASQISGAVVTQGNIIEEHIAGRTEFSKSFLLDNGTSLAVIYDSAVHFEEEGQWVEIDNTLKTGTNGGITNTAGVWDVVFPQRISKDDKISIQKDGYTLSFGMSGELRKQGNLEIMSEADQPDPTFDLVSVKRETANAEVSMQNESTVSETTVPEATVPTETVPEESELEATMPEVTIPEETTPESTAPTETEATEPQATVPQETTTEPTETVPEETTTEPTETVPEETITEPTETVPEETTTEPTETVPGETIAEPTETVPEETTTEPTETVPEETTIEPTETVSVEPTVPVPTVAVEINGKTQTFNLSTITAVTAQIQTIDRRAALAATDHRETVLTKPFSELCYPGVYTNTDLRYDLVGNQVKESIILDSYSSTLRGYQFTLHTGELIPVQEDDGHIDFYDKEKKTIIMTMPAPYLEDSAFAHSDDVAVTLSGKDGVYTLTYLLPHQWLAAEDRAWPVILDPVISASLDVDNIQDKTVGSKQSYSYTYGINEVGVDLTNGIQRVFLLYKDLPKLKSSDVILSARVHMYKPDNSSGTETVEVHKVNGTWSSSTLTWQNQPSFNSNVEDYVRAHEAGFYYWDITDIARDWYCGENTGMMFKVPKSVEDQTSTASWKQFYSSDFGSTVSRPTMYLYFRNNNGLEGYWDYTSSSAGRAGTGYINQYTGNLVWIHNDIGFGGNRMPVSISHVYNANDNENTDFGVGAGWRTNFNQKVFKWTEDTSYYVWEDGDGTDHYFKKESSGIYKDEDGLEMTLRNTGSGTQSFSIEDKNGNKSYFDAKGRLSKQVNNQETPSTLTVTYVDDTSLRIKTVKDGAGRSYKFAYSNDLLSKITYTGSGTTAISTVRYEYTDGNLTKITYPDGKSSTFTYTGSNLLSSATDIDGYCLRYEYNTEVDGQPSRVSKVSEYDGNTSGSALTFAYAHNQTTITDIRENTQILQFNNMGNTVSIQDGEGRAQYAAYAKNDSGAAGKGNQLTLSSKLQNTVVNLFGDSSFENGTLWTAVSGSAAISDGGYLGSKSMKLTGGRVNSGTVSIASGGSWTFSAYVKTEGTGGKLAIYVGDNAVATQPIPQTDTWERVEVSYTNTSSSAKTILAAVQCAQGQVVYIDCVQLEKAPTASRYNLIQNGDFRQSGSPAADWTGTGLTSSDIRATVSNSAISRMSTRAMLINGSPTAKKKISQTVPVSGSKGDCYVIGGWALADSVPLNTENEAREFGIRLIFNNTDDTTTTAIARFNCDTDSTANWQYSAAAAVAKKAYSSITVEAVYDYNANTAYFDGIQLFKEEFGSSYTYDDDGNVTSVTDLQKQKTQYEYTDNDLTKEILPTGAELTYTYDDHHNVLTATTETGLIYTFTYDTYGNNTSVSLSDGVSGNRVIKSTATYSSDGNRMVSATDATDKTTTYNYDANTNVLKSVQYPEDTTSTRTNYTYDSMYRMATAAATTDTGLSLSASYTYTDDLLTNLSTPSTDYTFTYGAFGLRTKVKAGGVTLANYTYEEDTNYLKTLAYGNGDSVNYTYNRQGQVTSQTYEDGDTVTYRYDNNGELASVTDSASGITQQYIYDQIGRPGQYRETGGEWDVTLTYNYNQYGQMKKVTETIGDHTCTTSATYDDDNRVATYRKNNSKVSYEYESRGRLKKMVTNHTYTDKDILEEIYTYRNPVSGQTSSQVTKFQTKSIGNYDVTYSYTYDGNGNILSVSDGTNTTRYVYDSANQLTRENNQAAGKTWVYSYDNAGNITSKSTYAYTTGTLGTATDTVTYGYTHATWGDLLKQYKGSTLVYDYCGNLKSGHDWDYTWEHGRQLASMSTKDDSETWSFTYNADGMRTSRTDGTTSYKYQYLNGQLVKMTVDDKVMYFNYDAQGTPTGIVYNGTTYYYVTNLQGDIVGIVNQSGNQLVGYSYDAWGNLLSTTGSSANTLGKYNPLRYRGYVYDQEYGLYYLQSRYYNPKVGRFINADNYPSTGQGILGNNMFAYCNNNPIIRIDASGEFFNTICGALIGGAIAAFTCGDGEAPGQAFLRGAMTGAIAGAGLDICIATAGGAGLAIAGITGAVSGVLDTYWEGKNQGKDVSLGEAATNGIIGAGLNLVFGAAGREVGNAVGNTLKSVGQAISTNFKRSITNKAGKVVIKKVVQAALTNSAYSTVQGAAAKVYSIITQKIMEDLC